MREGGGGGSLTAHSPRSAVCNATIPTLPLFEMTESACSPFCYVLHYVLFIKFISAFYHVCVTGQLPQHSAVNSLVQVQYIRKYGCTLNPTRLQKLMNVQKKIVRLICFKSYTDHSEPLFLDLKILNIYKINDYLCSIFMYSFNYCQNLPDFYSNYFNQNNEFHSYNTRNSTKLHVSYKGTNYRKYTVFNKGVSLWNSINEDIKNTNSYLSFKKKAKLYYLVSG